MLDHCDTNVGEYFAMVHTTFLASESSPLSEKYFFFTRWLTTMLFMGLVPFPSAVQSKETERMSRPHPRIELEVHGTHVSGTIGQATNNVVGTAGIAHLGCIMPIKVLNDNGDGTSADIAEGIFYAVNSGVSVINLSLGYNARSQVTNDDIIDPALEFAYNNDITVVCASGNDAGSSA